jgi:CDP-L-myo-inositol myo-inositolphosphotransferase
VAGIDRLAGSGASHEQLGEREEIRVRVAPHEFELPVGVILAAGTGSRLGVGSKALTRLAGITLLERAVSTLRAIGIEEILVVVGYEKERLREFVRERGLGVRLVENGDFGLGNGSSALVGARAAERRLLLSMVDHVVDPEALRRLLGSEAAFVLAVDSRPRACDLDEATKVRLQGPRVVAVGRELDVWEAVDAGLALCDAEVADVAERCLAAGEQSWNAVKRRWLGEGGEIEAVDLEGLFWIDVDTPADRRRAERMLVSLAARKPLDGPVSRLVNRRLSWPISLVLLRAGVSPGAATVATFFFALAAAAVLALGVVWPAALVAGGILVQLASIFDGVDGEIARASLRSSPSGRPTPPCSPRWRSPRAWTRRPGPFWRPRSSALS